MRWGSSQWCRGARKEQDNASRYRTGGGWGTHHAHGRRQDTSGKPSIGDSRPGNGWGTLRCNERSEERRVGKEC